MSSGPIADTLPLSAIESVIFYKRDEITTDLICCEVVTKQGVHMSHEEAPEWGELIAHLSQLPGFQAEWYAAVAAPAFATSETVAFRRQ